jgi:hypothetical protein
MELKNGCGKKIKGKIKYGNFDDKCDRFIFLKRDHYTSIYMQYYLYNEL